MARKDQEGRMRHGGRSMMEQEWPLARARTTKYFLNAGGALGVAEQGDKPPINVCLAAGFPATPAL
jgi:predicted acyl esterase